MFRLILLLVIHCSTLGCLARIFIFTKAECRTLDPEFCNFESCEIFSTNNKTNLDIYVKMHYKNPINQVSVALAAYKTTRNNRVSIFNETIDFCLFMRQSFASKFSAIATGPILKISNINHTCPYQHDIIIKGIINNFNFFSGMPAPKGNYVLYMRVSAFKKWKAEVQFYARSAV
ncbi:uncharacterized protein LOC111595670 [Drosophila hydei]|uniref:Uncharacterized protein LOC111595670 n=1 Tax=Drosophila hydei TaxID=7224 RepID=A0A6J1LNW5_DROHY|nr:uncharacterized protein LOC111595670 [Drosophila hydei]